MLFRSELEHIDRMKDEAADALSRVRSSRKKFPLGVFLDHLQAPSTKPPKEIELANPSLPEPASEVVLAVISDLTEPYISTYCTTIIQTNLK